MTMRKRHLVIVRSRHIRSRGSLIKDEELSKKCSLV